MTISTTMRVIGRARLFVKRMVEKYGIDVSHGVEHMTKVAFNVLAILNIEKLPLSPRQSFIAVVSGLLHDCCDKKYMVEEEGILEIRRFLEEETTFDRMEIKMMIQVIGTMSYSKVVANGIPVMDAYWKPIYHVVRHADLLEAYDVKRCFQYNRHAYPTENRKQLTNRVEKLMKVRVWKYVKDGHIFYPKCVEWADQLENKSRFQLGCLAGFLKGHEEGFRAGVEIAKRRRIHL